MGEFWTYALTSFALVLVIEGILPFLSPEWWRSLMVSLTAKSDQFLRIFGFCSMTLGVLIMALVHSGIIV